MSARVEVVSLPSPDDEIRVERHLLMIIGVAMVEQMKLQDDILLTAADGLHTKGLIDYTKDEFKRALGRLELKSIIHRDDEGFVTLTTTGTLLGCIVETVGVEGGICRITFDNDAPAVFEALEQAPEDDPANPEF